MPDILRHKILACLLAAIAAIAIISCKTQQSKFPSLDQTMGRDSAVYTYPAQCGLSRAINDKGKFGYLGNDGKWSIAPKYDLAYDFNERVALVASTDTNGELVYEAISTTGNTILSVGLKNCILDTQFSEGLLMFKEADSGRCGYINLNGETKIYLNGEILDAYRFHNGKAMVITSDGKGYIDLSGKIISFEKTKQEKETPAAQRPGNYIEKRDWSRIEQENPLYAEAKKILKGNMTEQDKENRTMILNYVEHLRTSYTTKDIDFIEQVFSDDALIIVGRVVKSSRDKELEISNISGVKYNMFSKREYVRHLRRIFAANETIEVEFSNFKIMRHPTKNGIYGVTLRQVYHSSIYSDDGWLFLLWDFRDEAMPKIHVRTWQQNNFDGRGTIPEDSLIGIHNFNLQ